MCFTNAGLTLRLEGADSPFAALVRAMAGAGACACLTVLDLTGNEITPKAAMYLATTVMAKGKVR